jgi:hypothetical protein
MPTARSDATGPLPSARLIDPRGHRFGAGLSALLLVTSFVAGWVPGVLFALLSIGTSAAFGLRYSIYGAIWRRVVAVARLGRTEPEHEYPPRFAQTLGSAALIASLLAFLLGATAAGWVLAMGVAGLQGVLAVTGYCLGCRLYFLRWWAPNLVTALWIRNGGAAPRAIERVPISYR